MPCSAALPVPTMIAVGVARPSAHGQAMISTAIAACKRERQARLGAERPASRRRSARPGPGSAGTKTSEMRSARRCIGALEPCASSTSRTICASVVSRPTLVARKTNEPVLFSVAPMTCSPGPFFDRQALAGQHALVERRAALVDDAVDRHLLARPHADQVADLDCFDRDILLDAVADDARGPGLQAHQGLDRGAGLLPGARLEPAAQQDQGDDDDRRLVVQVRREAPVLRPGAARA